MPAIEAERLRLPAQKEEHEPNLGALANGIHQGQRQRI